jgi:nitrite reductase (NADH) small subunit
VAHAHRVGTLAELEASGRLIVEIGGQSIGVFLVDGEIFAFRNRCVHQGGPVCDGRIWPAWRGELDALGYTRVHVREDEKVLVCPWHGAEFALRSGAFLADPRRRLRSYETYVVEDHVVVVA